MSVLRREDLTRIVVSLIADELGRARERAVPLSTWASWREATMVDEDGVGADSLDRISLATRFKEFFEMEAVGTEDYLLLAPTLGEWVDVVEETLRLQADGLRFRSSGSTGDAKVSFHSWARLSAEISSFETILEPFRRVVSFVPPHHMFGFLFGALLPSRQNAPVFDGRLKINSAPKWFQDGDLIVATPYVWRLIIKSSAVFPAGVIGVVSGAPCEQDVWSQAKWAGLERLIEVYGSTETAGVGWRSAPDAPFKLLPTWAFEGDWRPGEPQRLRAQEPAAPTDDCFDAPDQLQIIGEDLFRVSGRRDKVVQIAGVNVSIDAVRDHLMTHEFVKDVALRVQSDAADARLKAFYVLDAAAPIELELVEATLRRHALALDASARPASVSFGDALPQTEMGKLCDW